jgi:prophage regulatory protein
MRELAGSVKNKHAVKQDCACPEIERQAMIIDRYLRRSEVEKASGLSRSTIYRRIEQVTFPRPLDRGGHAVRWRETDLAAWKSGHRSGSSK